ncbi:MAG: hypothetical protein ACKPKO_51150, partial [Candidatus Fonsibacter sp.]
LRCANDAMQSASALSALVSGRDLLTQLTESRLCRLGVPNAKTMRLVDSIVYLRSGAWLQPEPPRVEIPLKTVAELGSEAAFKRTHILADVERRSFASFCPLAIEGFTCQAGPYFVLFMR